MPFIIPHYNQADVEKFAFPMPEGMPAIDAPPAPKEPVSFPTAYFGSRADAKGRIAQNYLFSSAELWQHTNKVAPTDYHATPRHARAS